jgi:signal transduction histidine kinase
MRFAIPRLHTIRTRLLLFFVLIVIVTSGAISVVTVVLEFRDARDRVVAQLKSVATLKEQQVNSWIGGMSLNLDIVLSADSIPGDLRTLASGTPGTDSWSAAYSRVLQRFLWASNRMGLFDELFFMDGNGDVVLSTEQGHIKQRLGLNDYFLQGLKGEFIEQPSYSLSLGKMTVVASSPVVYQSKPIGVIAGRAGLAGLNQVMAGRAGLGQTGETYLVGSNHRLLTELRRPGLSIPETYVRTEGADAAVDRQLSGSATYRGYAGNKVIGVYRWVPLLKVGLIAEQGEAEALQASRMTLVTIGIVTVVAALLAIGASVTLTRRIARPLLELGETAEQITAGDLDLVAKVRRRDEIGTLAQAFNRMTAQLRHLVRSLEKRTDHLRAINEAGRQISSILELDELLPHVARSLVKTFDYETVRILLLDPAATGFRGRLLTCDRSDCLASTEIDEPGLDRFPHLASVIREGEPVLAAVDPDGYPSGGADRETGLSEIAVPIRAGGGIAGALGIVARAQKLDEQDLFAAETLADQLAIGIENSRLYEHAHELAASKERQRLARDLHDAVSQTLFSVSLIAEVLPRIYERDPAQGKQRLEELRQLTRGALAEMRMLLLELRPASLAEASLPDLLRQLAEAVTGRARIPVEVELEACSGLASEVSVGLYRIAQEALNNVAKHSGATSARIRLLCEDPADGREVRLVVEDNGAGFDRDATPAGRLGLGIMVERAEAIGARLDISSELGTGTSVTVVLPASRSQT